MKKLQHMKCSKKRITFQKVLFGILSLCLKDDNNNNGNDDDDDDKREEKNEITTPTSDG